MINCVNHLFWISICHILQCLVTSSVQLPSSSLHSEHAFNNNNNNNNAQKLYIEYRIKI
jgi:hypothetical protein